VAQFYRANMGFIDTHDKNLEYYRINKISKKWWHPIFFHLLDCAVTNSWIVYCEKVGKVGQKKLRESLIEELMGQYIEGKEKKSSKGLIENKKQCCKKIPLTYFNSKNFDVVASNIKKKRC